MCVCAMSFSVIWISMNEWVIIVCGLLLFPRILILCQYYKIYNEIIKNRSKKKKKTTETNKIKNKRNYFNIQLLFLLLLLFSYESGGVWKYNQSFVFLMGKWSIVIPVIMYCLLLQINVFCFYNEKWWFDHVFA